MSGYATMAGEGHLPDATLLALIDGETATTDALTAHLGSCMDCDGRLSALRRASGLLRGSLPDVAIPPMSLPKAPDRRRSWAFSYPAVAAATVLLLASVATATPVRHWIARRFLSAPATQPEMPTTPNVRSTAPAAGIIASFAPVDTVLEIRVDVRQHSGSIHLIATASERISAQALAGAAAEELVVLPGRLRIINSANSAADYRIAVPSSVRSVVVIIAGDRALTVRVDEKLDRRIELDRKSR